MRKQILWGTIILFIVIVCVVLIINFPKSKQPVKGCLNINVIYIVDTEVTIYSEYVDLPLIKIFNCLGYNVQWIDDDVMYIITDEEKYILELKDKASLKKDGDNFNLISPVPGSTSFHSEIVENEVILDSDTVNCILFFMGKSMCIDVDYDNAVVYMTPIKNS